LPTQPVLRHSTFHGIIICRYPPNIRIYVLFFFQYCQVKNHKNSTWHIPHKIYLHFRNKFNLENLMFKSSTNWQNTLQPTPVAVRMSAFSPLSGFKRIILKRLELILDFWKAFGNNLQGIFWFGRSCK
jgi:hypothetical protein